MAGMIATILSTSRAVINGAQALLAKVDPGGGNDISPQCFFSPGEDSRPLDGDSLLGVATSAAGRFVGVGSADPLNVGISAKGEVRRYSRDSAGVIRATIHIKADGSIEVASVPGGVSLVIGADGSIAGINSSGSFSLEPSGSMLINGAQITPGGDVITASGISLDNHGTSPGSFAAGGDAVTGVGGAPT